MMGEIDSMTDGGAELGDTDVDDIALREQPLYLPCRRLRGVVMEHQSAAVVAQRLIPSIAFFIHPAFPLSRVAFSQYSGDEVE